MNLNAYLSEHDGKPRPDGPECIRLAKAIGCSSMYLYLAALGHKSFGPEKALKLHEKSQNKTIEPATVNASVQWHRSKGRWFYRSKVA